MPPTKVSPKSKAKPATKAAELSAKAKTTKSAQTFTKPKTVSTPTIGVGKSKTKPVTEPVTKQFTKKPVSSAVSKPVTKSASKPASKPAAKPTSKSTGKPTVKLSTPPKTKAFEDKKAKGAESSEEFKRVSVKVAYEEMDLLCQEYPEADCELDFETPFQLITAVIMSAQTTDTNVNKVTKNLYQHYPDANALANAPLDHIKELIRSTGYYNAKATNIQNCAAKLVDKFAGEVPRNLEDLITLPGVGRKTANVVLGVCFGVPGWTVDTHVQRLSKRLGLSNEMDPEKIEYELQKLFPDRDWSKLSITLIWHGRRVCFARKPNCEECSINNICPSSQVLM